MWTVTIRQKYEKYGIQTEQEQQYEFHAFEDAMEMVGVACDRAVYETECVVRKERDG